MKGILQSYRKSLDRRNLRLFFVYFCFFFFNGPLEQSLPLFFDSRGYSTFLYGVFLSCSNGIGIILPAMVAFLTINFNYRIITSVGLLISMVSGILLCRSESSLLVIVLTLLLCSGRSFFNFSFGSAVTTLIPSEDRAQYFVIRDIFLFGGISLGLFLGSYIIDRLSIDIMYLLFSLGMSISIVQIIIFYKKGKNTDASISGKDTSFKLSNLKNKTVFSLIIIQCLKLVYGTTVEFVPLLGVKIGVDYDSILKLLSFVTFVNVILSFFLAYYSNGKGKKNLFILDIVIDIIPCMLFAFTKSIVVYMIGLVISSIKDALAPLSFAYLYDCLDQDMTVAVVGLIESTSNVVGIIAPILIGAMWQFSYRIVFVLGAIACFLATLIGILNLPDVQPGGTATPGQ